MHESIIVEIGNIPIALKTDNPSFRRVLEDRYAPFLGSSKEVHSEFTLELLEPRPESETADDNSDDESDLQVKKVGSRWTLKRGDFHAEWDAGTGLGTIRQSLNPYSVDTVLRIVHSLILAREGGFLLHAASAARDGRAFIFSGISGAGKTTISRLAPPDVTLLTDEISYIKPENGAYRAFGTPFAGELAKLGENVSAPISTLFFLEKGSENRIEDLSTGEAIRKLMRNILFFAEDPELVDSIFKSACQFVEKVPVRRLEFAPDRRVWDRIRP